MFDNNNILAIIEGEPSSHLVSFGCDNRVGSFTRTRAFVDGSDLFKIKETCILSALSTVKDKINSIRVYIQLHTGVIADFGIRICTSYIINNHFVLFECVCGTLAARKIL